MIWHQAAKVASDCGWVLVHLERGKGAMALLNAPPACNAQDNQRREVAQRRKHLCAGVLARVVPALANPAKLG